MPTLADIYSMIDSAKRRGTDFIRNPGTSLQQMVGNANDKARAFNELNDAALDEFRATGDLYGPKGKELAQSLAGAYNPVGMTVWHGSPHIFEKFDLAKKGTGEGGASYGSGLYMAQAKPTAERYRENISTSKWLSENQFNSDGSPNRVMQTAYQIDSGVPKDEIFDGLSLLMPKASKDEINSVIKQAQTVFNEASNKGAIYKVDLPDTHVRRMLDWDEPLKNQPAQVRKLAKSLGMDLNDLGGDLVGKIGKGEEGKQILEKAGIRGIKYLDQMSRDKQKGTRNFVVFDPNHLTILERNNQPIK